MNTQAKILVATDVAIDGSLVRKLLSNDFENVTVSALPDRHISDFDRCQPEVLILAFDSLMKAESYYLSLYRHSECVYTLPHRTLILCNSDDLKKVYELCKREQFDDYILFWPLVHDTPRLPMAVMQALRFMSLTKEDGPTIRQLAMQARRIAELEQTLSEYVAVGLERASNATHGIRVAHQSIDAALDVFSQRLTAGELRDLVDVKNIHGLRREIEKIKQDDVGKNVLTAVEATQSLKNWVGSIETVLSPQLEAVRELQATAVQIKPEILIVDDDPLQLKLLEKALSDAGVDLVLSANGTDTMRILRWRKPELILMDVNLPDVTGIEVLRRIRSQAHLASIPVIMVTGHSEKSIVVDSVKAGADGFLVKPFDKATLIHKIHSVMKNAPPSLPSV